MELNNPGRDDIPAAFVRDWRIRRISPSKLINPDGAQIVRRRTVITIGSMSESKGSACRQEDQPISASEVGETACGKISITVKTLPKSTDIRTIDSLFDSEFHNSEEEWPTRDTVPLKSSSVTDPSWISTNLTNRTKDLSIQDLSVSKVGRASWAKDEHPSHDIDATVVSGNLITNAKNKKTTLDNLNGLSKREIEGKPVYSVTEIDIDQPIQPVKPKLLSDLNKECNSPRISLKPTFKMILGNESKVLHLGNVEQVAPKVEKPRQIQQDSMTCDYIRYHEWLKTLEQSEEEPYLSQPQTKGENQIINSSLVDYNTSGSVDCTPNGIIVVESAKSPSLPKSILKQGRNDSSSSESTRSDYFNRKDKSNPVRNHCYPEEIAAGSEHSSIVDRDKKENSLIHTKPFILPETSCNSIRLKESTDHKPSFIKKVLPIISNQLSVPSSIEDYPQSRQTITTKAEAADRQDVINKNQINSMKSVNTNSGCWKKSSITQDGNPSLSSGMAIDKATELVRQFFNSGDNGQNSSLVNDQKTLCAPTSEDIITHSNQSAIQSPPNNSTVSACKQEDQQQQRGRSPIKSKIPLRIQRPTSSVSPASHNSSPFAPFSITAEKANVSSRYMANKPKPIAHRPRAPLTGRTRSVEGYRQSMTSLSNSLLYNSAMTRDEGTYPSNNYRKVNSFQQATDFFIYNNA